MKKTTEITCRVNRTVELEKKWNTIVTESQAIVVMNAAFFASVEKIKYNFLFSLSSLLRNFRVT